MQENLYEILPKDREALNLYIKKKDGCQETPELTEAYDTWREAEKTYRALQNNVVIPTLPEITPRRNWIPMLEYRREYVDHYVYEELYSDSSYRAKVIISVYTGKVDAQVTFARDSEAMQHFYHSFSKEGFVDPIKAMIWCERLIEWLRKTEHAPFLLDEDDL